MTAPQETHRVCIGCGQEKEIEEFHAHKNRRGVYAKRKICRECVNAERRRLYDSEPGRAERYRAAAKTYKEAHFFKARAILWNSHYEPGNLTAKDLARLWKNQRGRCALSGRKLNRDAQLDHILPKTKGGQAIIENLQWLSKEVNDAKRNLTERQFRQLCLDIVTHLALGVTR